MSATTDPYLLRLLLWCGNCDLRMVCAFLSGPRSGGGTINQRTYKCGLACRREVLDADAIESIVWTAAERRATISDIAVPYRQSVLEMLLVKATIGPTAADISYVWRT
ncbi:hypothetical protein [Micromonospora sp. NPDC005206]|uniref:hypothetical protein n=1 Tax=Micromonospora sp. NPDC005206 TaxID=3157022 RepID=UPI0033A0B859